MIKYLIVVNDCDYWWQTCGRFVARCGKNRLKQGLQRMKRGGLAGGVLCCERARGRGVGAPPPPWRRDLLLYHVAVKTGGRVKGGEGGEKTAFMCSCKIWCRP